MKKEINALDFFLDWKNNYLTVPVIANDYGITEKQANELIKQGRKENEIKSRLNYLKKQIKAECISELLELQSLAPYIPNDDTLLKEWSGVPEFEADKMLTKHEFEELTTIKRTDYGVFYHTVTPVCKYGQAVRLEDNYFLQDYVNYYYKIYTIDYNKED